MEIRWFVVSNATPPNIVTNLVEMDQRTNMNVLLDAINVEIILRNCWNVEDVIFPNIVVLIVKENIGYQNTKLNARRNEAFFVQTKEGLSQPLWTLHPVWMISSNLRMRQ